MPGSSSPSACWCSTGSGTAAPLCFETRIAGLAPASRSRPHRRAHADHQDDAAVGAIGGIAGGIHALGSVGRFVSGFSRATASPASRWLLGRGSAVGILLAAILFGALATSGATIQLFSDVPVEIVNVLQGMVMIFAVVTASAGSSPTEASGMIDNVIHAAIVMTTPLTAGSAGRAGQPRRRDRQYRPRSADARRRAAA